MRRNRLVAGQLGEVQLLPDPRRSIAIARRRRRSGRALAVVAVARQLVLAAQARQPVDEQHAVDVERLVEADQARLVARRPRRVLTPRKPARSTTPCRWPRRFGDAEEPAVAVRHRHHRRDGEDLAGIAQRKEEAARAALDRQPGLAERLGAGGLQPIGEPGLEIAQGLLVGHSLARRLASRRRGSSPSARSDRPA